VNRVKITASDFPAKGNELRATEMVEIARIAERAGVDRLGITDFPFHEECIAMMSACLVSTEALEVESLVTSPFRRAPDVAACTWATLSDLSAGRAILGIGRGGGMAETWVEPWGFNRPRALWAVEQFVEICRALWRGEAAPGPEAGLNTSGRKLEFLPEHPVPILLAARGPRMLEVAGRIADIAHIALPFLGVDYMNDNVAIVRDAADKAGRAPGELEIDMTIALSVSEDRAFAREAAKLTSAVGILWVANAEKPVLGDLGDLGFADERGIPREFTVAPEIVDAIANRWNMWTGEPLPPDVAAGIDDETIDTFVVAGTPDECADRLQTLLARVRGITGVRFKLPPLTGPDSFAHFSEMVRFCGELRPAVESAMSGALAAD
jgi:5,10-methylenetetrahydromethanopterin reductase